MRAGAAPDQARAAPGATPARAPLPRRAPAPPRARAAAAAAAAGAAPLVESLTLLRFRPDCPGAELQAELDRVWSLQYMTPGPVCGAAGPLRALARAPGGSAPLPPPTAAAAVFFRCPTEIALRRFLESDTVQRTLGAALGSTLEAAATLSFESAAPRELEALFRRGADWAEGWELVAALALTDPAAYAAGGGAADAAQLRADAEEFLALARRLAESSAYGAVAAGGGRALALEAHGPPAAGQAPAGAADTAGAADAGGSNAAVLPHTDYVLTARFGTRAQLDAFAACPAVAALLAGDARAPLRAAWAAAMEVAPARDAAAGP